MPETAREEAEKALAEIGWSPAAVRRYPEKAFDNMVEFYARALSVPETENWEYES